MQKCYSRIEYLSSHPQGTDRPPTVFDTILNPNLEKGQYTPPLGHLAADAYSFLNAGTGTASDPCIVALFNLLDGPPHMLKRLKAELCNAIPDVRSVVSWENLEKLPYLVCMNANGDIAIPVPRVLCWKRKLIKPPIACRDQRKPSSDLRCPGSPSPRGA